MAGSRRAAKVEQYRSVSLLNIRLDLHFCRQQSGVVENSIHAADADAKRQFCRIRFGGVNWT